jgi:hypothetical protein
VLSRDQVRNLFDGVPRLRLRQAWREAPEPSYRPATAGMCFDGEHLWALGELQDEDIFSTAERFNDPLRNRGDFFEIILHPQGQPAYYEFHVTPNNMRSQYRFPRVHFAQDYQIDHSKEELLDVIRYDKPIFDSWTWPCPSENHWTALARIPLGNLLEPRRGLPGLRFNFCRYDWTQGQPEPCLSTCSPHREISFHRDAEWGWACLD